MILTTPKNRRPFRKRYIYNTLPTATKKDKKKRITIHHYKKEDRCCPPFTNQRTQVHDSYRYPADFVPINSDSYSYTILITV